METPERSVQSEVPTSAVSFCFAGSWELFGDDWGATIDSETASLRVLSEAGPIYVAGHRGLVGSAIWRQLSREGHTNLIGRTKAELDLRDRALVFEYFHDVRPAVVIVAAAKVGGIFANASRPVDFLTDNLQIQVNVLDAALEVRVPRLMFLGSSCIYPKFAQQPISESSLLTGLLEPTNDAYAIAKIAGIMHVQAVRRQYDLPWISAMPTNLYGPGDNFATDTSHVLPALIRRYDTAQRHGVDEVVNWGSGTPRREFMHVDDMASACLHLLETFDGPQQVNVGTGEDLTIAEIAEFVSSAVGFQGTTSWDASKPDGTPRKLLDVSTLTASGWNPSISLADGIASTVAWYRANEGIARV